MNTLVSITIAGIISLNCLVVILLWRKFRKIYAMFCELKSTSFKTFDFFRASLIRYQHQQRILDDMAGSIRPRKEIRFTSQFGEDLVIQDLLGDIEHGIFVEAGAYDGINLSNTFALEQCGWNGLLVEPNPVNAAACRSNRPLSLVEHYALGDMASNGEVEFTAATSENDSPLSFVKADEKHLKRCIEAGCVLTKYRVPIAPLDFLLEKHAIESVDFFSLDVEGMELDVLRGFSILKYKPRLIMVEKQYDMRDDAVKGYLEAAGYANLLTRACNAFFVPMDFVTEGRRRVFPYDLSTEY